METVSRSNFFFFFLKSNHNKKQLYNWIIIGHTRKGSVSFEPKKALIPTIDELDEKQAKTSKGFNLLLIFVFFLKKKFILIKI